MQATHSKLITNKQRAVSFAIWATRILVPTLFFFLTSSCQKKGTIEKTLKTADKPSSEKNSSKSELQDFGVSQNPLDKWNKIDNPSEDGWETEALAKLASEQLKKLGTLFFTDGSINDFITKDFTTHRLSKKNLKTLLQNKNLIIQSATISNNEEYGGKDYLQKELITVRNLKITPSNKNYVKFKVTSIEVDSTNQSFETTALFTINFKTKKNLIQKNAVWSINWKGLTGTPKISNIVVRSYDQSTRLNKNNIFTEVTGSVISSNSSYEEQLAYGMNHWLSRMPVRAMLNRFGTPGISVADVNGDGLDDLFLCQEPGLPNRLFIQKENGQAIETSKEWGIDWIEDSRSSIFADFDNDGDQDLAVACYGMVVIAENDQQERFKPAAILKTSWSTSSISAADYDNDGLLDLYVCAYVNEDNGSSIGTGSNEFIYHDAENGAPNSLLKNATKEIGEFSFIDVTEESGLNQNNSRWSFAASWEDFDNDGDQDLYVANDYGRNNLYENDNGIFKDIAAKSYTEDSASGMSVTWADYNKDGMMDLYVSNMFSAAGNRITNQKEFKSAVQESIRNRFKRFARGNTLLQNEGLTFKDTSLSAGVNMGRWAWGSNFIDFNNDTFPDLVVANGYLTSKNESGDL